MSDEIIDGAYMRVEGTVGQVYDGRFVIEIMRPQSQYPDRITVWRPDFTVQTGDRVSVKGWASWKARTYEKRDQTTGYGVDMSLNKPRLDKHQPVQPADSGWGASGTGEEVPW